MIGSIFAAFFTQYLTPSYSFAVFSFTSAIVCYGAYMIDPNVEHQNTGAKKRREGMWANAKLNMKEIKEAL